MIDINELRRRVRTGDHNPHQPRPTPTPTPRSGGSKGLSGCFWLIIVIITILVVLNQCSQRATESAATYYVTRMVNVRDKPQKGGSTILTRLSRGALVTGKPTRAVPDRNSYLAVSSGAVDGGYVWMVNLTDQPLPAITGGRYPFSVETRVWAMRKPDSNGEKLGEIVPDRTYFASGDLVSSWVEVEMPTGGVGYLPKNEVRRR